MHSRRENALSTLKILRDGLPVTTPYLQLVSCATLRPQRLNRFPTLGMLYSSDVTLRRTRGREDAMEEKAALRWIILSITPLPYIELTFAALSSTSTRRVVFPRRFHKSPST